MLKIALRRLSGLPQEQPQLAASRAAYGLLRELMVREGLLDPEAPLPETEKAPGGKPFFPGRPEVHFNISHSGPFLACGISDREVGVDIQEYRAIPGTVMTRFFSEAERRRVLEAEDPEAAFAEVWAERECRAKYTGRGIFGSRRDAEAGSEDCRVTLIGTGMACALAVCSPCERIDETVVCEEGMR